MVRRGHAIENGAGPLWRQDEPPTRLVPRISVCQKGGVGEHAAGGTPPPGTGQGASSPLDVVSLAALRGTIARSPRFDCSAHRNPVCDDLSLAARGSNSHFTLKNFSCVGSGPREARACHRSIGHDWPVARAAELCSSLPGRRFCSVRDVCSALVPHGLLTARSLFSCVPSLFLPTTSTNCRTGVASCAAS